MPSFLYSTFQFLRMPSKICLAFLVGLYVDCGSLMAQDIHFSQYLSAPFNLNPSLTGDFKGDYRLIGNYRNQWNSITVPYRTFGLGGDAAAVGGVKNLGLGGSFYYDDAGDGRLSTTILQISASFGYPISRDSAHKVFVGLQPL